MLQSPEKTFHASSVHHISETFILSQFPQGSWLSGHSHGPGPALSIWTLKLNFPRGRSDLPVPLCHGLWQKPVVEWASNKYGPREAVHFQYCFLACKLSLFFFHFPSYSIGANSSALQQTPLLSDSLFACNTKPRQCLMRSVWGDKLRNKHKTMLWIGIQLKYHLNADYEHCISIKFFLGS